jgi:hypothetical protein
MDAVAPALIGIGLYLAYVAWESHKNGTPPTPLTKITSAIQSSGGTPTPGQIGYGAAIVPVNQTTGVAQ